MTKLSVVRVVLALVAVCAAFAPRSLSARTLLDSLVIRVYDLASLDVSARVEAVDEARGILAEAGLPAEWRDCGALVSPGPCFGGTDTLTVRIVREPTGAVQREPGERRQALGYSVIDVARRTGALATIYMDRVEQTARGAGADVTTLLGRAIAHEVGHLLLRSNEHSERGLMRAVWTEREMARNTPKDWVFDAPERRQLRSLWLTVGEAATR